MKPAKYKTGIRKDSELLEQSAKKYWTELCIKIEAELAEVRALEARYGFSHMKFEATTRWKDS